MAGDQLVREAVSWMGIYQLHVIRMSAPVSLEPWMDHMEAVACDQRWTGEWAGILQRHEEDIDVHHLWLFWRIGEEGVKRIQEIMVQKYPELRNLAIGGKTVLNMLELSEAKAGG